MSSPRRSARLAAKAPVPQTPPAVPPTFQTPPVAPLPAPPPIDPLLNVDDGLIPPPLSNRAHIWMLKHIIKLAKQSQTAQSRLMTLCLLVEEFARIPELAKTNASVAAIARKQCLNYRKFSTDNLHRLFFPYECRRLDAALSDVEKLLESCPK